MVKLKKVFKVLNQQSEQREASGTGVSSGAPKDEESPVALHTRGSWSLLPWYSPRRDSGGPLSDHQVDLPISLNLFYVTTPLMKL